MSCKNINIYVGNVLIIVEPFKYWDIAGKNNLSFRFIIIIYLFFFFSTTKISYVIKSCS